MLVDSHTHLEAVGDLEGVLLRAKKAGVEKIITVGSSVKSSKKAIEIADVRKNIPEIYATCGLHPKDAKKELADQSLYQCINTLKQIATSSDKVVGVGECGLDYFLEANNQRLATSGNDIKFQKELFELQISLASDMQLPLVIHCRDAWDDILETLTSNSQKLKARGVFHSWTGDWQAAKQALDLGFYISFSGIVTFKNAREVAQVAKKIPIERMLIETDSPYLSPDPFRSQNNEPKNVKIIAAFIAKTQGQSVKLITSKTTANAHRLFKLL